MAVNVRSVSKEERVFQLIEYARAIEAHAESLIEWHNPKDGNDLCTTGRRIVIDMPNDGIPTVSVETSCVALKALNYKE